MCKLHQLLPCLHTYNSLVLHSYQLMIIIQKFFILPILVFLAISLSMIEETFLRSIYHNIGTLFDISWMTISKNSPSISNFGHGWIFFAITLVSLSSIQKDYRKIIGFILIFNSVFLLVTFLIWKWKGFSFYKKS